MSNEIGDKQFLHLSELDEFLAQGILEAKKLPLGFNVRRLDSQGNISIEQIKSLGDIGEQGIDFELSPSEYQSLDAINILDYTDTTVYTSSAYEFFDFILMYFSKFDCLLDLKDSSWRVKILSFENAE